MSSRPKVSPREFAAKLSLPDSNSNSTMQQSVSTPEDTDSDTSSLSELDLSDSDGEDSIMSLRGKVERALAVRAARIDAQDAGMEGQTPVLRAVLVREKDIASEQRQDTPQLEEDDKLALPARDEQEISTTHQQPTPQSEENTPPTLPAQDSESPKAPTPEPLTPPTTQVEVPRELITEFNLRPVRSFSSVSWPRVFHGPPVFLSPEDDEIEDFITAPARTNWGNNPVPGTSFVQTVRTPVAETGESQPLPQLAGKDTLPVVQGPTPPVALPIPSPDGTITKKLAVDASQLPHVETNSIGIDLDPRLDPSVVVFKDGKAILPPICDGCKSKRRFCSRGFPCTQCIQDGKTCTDRTSKPREILRRTYKRRETSDSELPPTPPRGVEECFAEVIRAAERERQGAEGNVFTFIETNSFARPSTPPPRPDALPPTPKSIRKPKAVKPKPRAVEFVQKPAPMGEPSVWAEGRQELCETVPYYRSYQSGAYQKDGKIHGYMMDGFGGERDFVGSHVVISQAGGKSELDAEGIRVLKDDQCLGDKLVRSMCANKDACIPLVIILGKNCIACPTTLTKRYNVLDWFKVTHIWSERESVSSQKIRIKFRFEKLDTSRDGWWMPAPSSPETQPHGAVVEQTCEECKEASPHIYTCGWMCLNRGCKVFNLINGLVPTDSQLTYTPNFLHARHPWDPLLSSPPYPLRPTPHALLSSSGDGSDVSRSSWKGLCCPHCGRCSSRFLWAGWRCPTCFFWLSPSKSPLDAMRLSDPHKPVYENWAVSNDYIEPGSGIVMSRIMREGFTCMRYELPDRVGTVWHLLATRATNGRERDADWMLGEYQRPEMRFMRHALPTHVVAGMMLTTQFSFNAGLPYKFIVDVATTPIDASPPVVQRALELINQRVNLIQPNTSFNEILSVGYFEEQKMDYHDDGEKGLGPTVASISLGGSAIMKFRPKAGKKRGALKRKGVDGEDDAEDEASPKKGSKRDKLILELNHGDMMIMSGARIQEVYEHAVTCTGLFRVAATARFIDQSINSTLTVPKTTQDAPSVASATAPVVGADLDGVLREQMGWSNEQWGDFLAKNLGSYGRGSEVRNIGEGMGELAGQGAKVGGSEDVTMGEA